MNSLDRIRSHSNHKQTADTGFSIEKVKARLSHLMVDVGLPALPPSAGALEKTYSFPTYRQAMKVCALLMDGLTLDGWKFEVVEPRIKHLQWTVSGEGRKVCAAVGLEHAAGKPCVRITYFEA